MTTILRRKVSENRIRLVDDKYDLDLTYICDNVIAMGYPSDQLFQGLIRNQIEQVSKFLNEKHPNSFKIFNLCIETDYNFAYFNNMVETIPLRDHDAPKFSQINEFCSSIHKWLSESSSNVAVVHCKAGKGRTGTMISCYYIYSGKFTDPFDAMDEFSRKRCKDCKGVTIPSQRRYIEYYADYLLQKRVYEKVKLYLKTVIVSLKQINPDTCKKLNLVAFKDFDHKIVETNKVKLLGDSFKFEFANSVELFDDVTFCFYTKKKVCLFKITFNTFCFVQDNAFASNESSRQGSKTINNGQITWLLRKKDIDLAFKNKTLHDDLTVGFRVLNLKDFWTKPIYHGLLISCDKLICHLNYVEKIEFTFKLSNDDETPILESHTIKNDEILRPIFGLDSQMSRSSAVSSSSSTNSINLETFQRLFLNRSLSVPESVIKSQVKQNGLEASKQSSSPLLNNKNFKLDKEKGVVDFVGDSLSKPISKSPSGVAGGGGDGVFKKRASIFKLIFKIK